MDTLKFLKNNWDMIISNPIPFLAVFVLTAGGIWAYAKHYFYGRIEDMNVKISLRDDQVKYYKDLSDAKFAATKSLAETIPSSIDDDNLKNDILREIQYLKKYEGKALAANLSVRLQPKYSFSIILSELLLLNKQNLITWSESPSPPEALSEIKIERQ